MSEDITAILNRGHAAQMLLANETFNATCEDLLKVAAVRWLVTSVGQAAMREELHVSVRAIHALRDELQARADAAVKTQADIDRAERRKKEI